MYYSQDLSFDNILLIIIFLIFNTEPEGYQYDKRDTELKGDENNTQTQKYTETLQNLCTNNTHSALSTSVEYQFSNARPSTSIESNVNIEEHLKSRSLHDTTHANTHWNKTDVQIK